VAQAQNRSAAAVNAGSLSTPGVGGGAGGLVVVIVAASVILAAAVLGIRRLLMSKGAHR
jgi:hypothetical protein